MDEIFGETLALDFDLTCTTRLLFYDAEKEKREANRMAAMFGAEIEDEEQERRIGDRVTVHIPGEM